MFKEAGIHQALVDLGLEKQAVITPALQVASPTAYSAVSRLSEAIARPFAGTMGRLAEALERRATQRATKGIHEAAMKAQPGAYPGTVQLPGGQTVSSKALEEMLGYTPIATSPAAAQAVAPSRALRSTG